MRKWMRDRLTRRKKTPAEASAPAPPPLQPAYFDAEQQPGSEHDSASDSGNIEPEISAPLPPAAEARPVRRPRARSPEPTTDALPGAVSDEPSSEARPVEERSSEALPVLEGRASPQPVASGSGQPGRGRRRRGGRGRGGRGREQAVAQAFAPAAAKGSIPGAVVDGVEDEASDAGEAERQTPVAASQLPSIPAAPQRPPKGVVVLAIGLPGSGKSSWFKRHDVVPLSSDMVRSLLFDDVREQRFQDLVFSNLRSMLKARLIAKRPMNYVDATNLTPQERQHWIKLAKDYQYEVHAVFFDVPLEVCLERHQRRDRVVPEDVMRRMAAKLKPPAFEEGFAKITVVRVKKKEPAEA
jgi:predicted kinase